MMRQPIIRRFVYEDYAILISKKDHHSITEIRSPQGEVIYNFTKKSDYNNALKTARKFIKAILGTSRATVSADRRVYDLLKSQPSTKLSALELSEILKASSSSVHSACRRMQKYGAIQRELRTCVSGRSRGKDIPVYWWDENCSELID